MTRKRTGPVKGIEPQDYWTDPPAAPSPGLVKWARKIRAGWSPNARISGMGYHEAAEFFNVYIWEYLHVLSPMMYTHTAYPLTIPEGWQL